ncbi:MAG: phosphotransferase [Actinomycetota bacterium]
MALSGPERAADGAFAPDIAFSSDGIVVRSIRGKVMGQSPTGPVIRYAATCFDPASGNTAKRVLIGRTLRGDGGSAAFHVMKQLWEGGFRDDFYTMPEPVAHLNALNLLVEGRASGRPLDVHLDDPAASQILVRLAARWLARFHATPLEGVPAWDVDADIDRMATDSAAMAELLPDAADRIRALSRRVATGVLGIDADIAVPTHGSFRPENVHVGRSRIGAGDFGEVAMGHPARDLAHFIGASLATVYRRQGSFLPVDPWNCAFIQEYVGIEGPECLPPLPLLIASELLGHLRQRNLERNGVSADVVEAFLDECSRWLDVGNVHR